MVLKDHNVEVSIVSKTELRIRLDEQRFIFGVDLSPDRCCLNFWQTSTLVIHKKATSTFFLMGRSLPVSQTRHSTRDTWM